MIVSTLEAPVPAARPASVGPLAPARTPVRPGRQAGRGRGPQSRPRRPLDTPVLRRSALARTRSCSVAPPVHSWSPRAQPQWRLTERAIALVLVTGLLVVTVALAVVGLTAIRVTGVRYQASHGLVSVPAAAPHDIR